MRDPSHAPCRVAGLLTVLLLGAGCSDPPAEPRPNVVFISIDSLRADHLGCYGYERDTSPHLDALAAQGARFEHVVAESSWTLPTHVTLLTGLSSNVHGVTHDGRKLADGILTLAEALREQGYRTRGLYSAPYLHPLFGFGQGFDAQDYESVIGHLVYDRPKFDPTQERFAQLRMQDMKTATTAVTSPTIVDRAVAFLEEPRDRPFFLFLHFFDVHFDYDPPEECWRRFDPDYQGSLDCSAFPFNDAIHAGMDPRELQHVIARYDGEIYFTDGHLGRLWAALDRLGLHNDTLVVVIADHGDEFFEHGEKGHQKTLFDEVVKVPWIVRLPGEVPEGLVVSAQARHLDVMPTVLGLLGIPRPAGLMGEDLSPVLRGERAARDLTAVSRLESPRVPFTSALRTPAWKLVTRAVGSADERVAWYDLRADPGEQAPATADPQRIQQALSRLAEFGRVEDQLRRAIDLSGSDVDVPDAMRQQLDALGYVK